MPRTAISIVIAALLLLAGLYNIGAGFAQFWKAELVSGTASALSSVGESVAAANKDNPFAQGSNAKLKGQAKDLRNTGARSSAFMYLAAIGIVLAAVLQLVGGGGVFAKSAWTPKVLMFAGVAGVLVEIQDLFEDGLGAGQIVFLVISAGAIYLSLQLGGAVGKPATPKSNADAAEGDRAH